MTETVGADLQTQPETSNVDNVNTSDLLEVVCAMCTNRIVNKSVKCPGCSAAYHPACAKKLK